MPRQMCAPRSDPRPITGTGESEVNSRDLPEPFQMVLSPDQRDFSRVMMGRRAIFTRGLVVTASLSGSAHVTDFTPHRVPVSLPERFTGIG